MKYTSLSKVGLVRSNNQDRVLTLEHNDMILAMVCDGIGGAQAGDVASQATITHFEHAFKSVDSFEKDTDVINWFEKELTVANRNVLNMARENPDYAGMGTTCIAVVIKDKRAVAFNVGDSRIYDYRHHKLNLLSHDQTYAYMMYLENEITKEEAEHHPKRNILMNAIGIRGIVSFETIRIPNGWDRLMLCSDGLHDYVENDLIESAFEYDIEKTALVLANYAYESGGFDNVSIVIVEGEPHE